MRATEDFGLPPLDDPEGTASGTSSMLIEDAPSSLRLWLLRGRLGADPRRRFGKHAQARGLLASDQQNVPPPAGRWTELVSALHRHTAAGGLSRLADEDRRLLTLAYLEGRSNREIASMLSVSVRTVGRRLSKALERMEKGLLWTSTWISALAVLFLSYAAHRAGFAWRTVEAAVRGPGQQAVAVLAAAGAVGAVVVGVVLTSPGSPGATHPSTATAVHVVPLAGKAPAAAPAGVHSTIDGKAVVTTTLTVTRQAGHPEDPVAGPLPTSDAGHPGCDGNPTSAPPPVPVGPRGGRPGGSPVTHPTAGGCGPHARD